MSCSICPIFLLRGRCCLQKAWFLPRNLALKQLTRFFQPWLIQDAILTLTPKPPPCRNYWNQVAACRSLAIALNTCKDNTQELFLLFDLQLWIDKGCFACREEVCCSVGALAAILESRVSSYTQSRSVSSSFLDFSEHPTLTGYHDSTLRCPDQQKHFSFPIKTQIFFFQSLQWFMVRPKPTKSNGVLQSKFCIFTCPKDWHLWTLEWVFKTLRSFRLAHCFLINSKRAFYLLVSQQCITGTAKKHVRLGVQNSVKITFCLFVWKPLQSENFSFSVSLSKITHEHSKIVRFSTSYEHKEWG